MAGVPVFAGSRGRWIGRQPGSRAYYSSHFRAVFGRSLEDAWAEWVTHEKTFPAGEPRARSGNTDHPGGGPVVAVAGLRVPRLLRSIVTDDLCRLELPGRSGARGGDLRRDGRSAAPDGHQGAAHLPSGVARLGPQGPSALLHDRQWRASRPGVSRSRDRPHARAPEDARIGDLAFNRADQSLWGIRHLNGLASIVRMGPPYTGGPAQSR